MRIPINLSSQPQENLRSLRAAVALSAVAALLLTGVVVQRERRSRNEFRSLTEQIQRLERDLGVLGGEQQELERWLATPQVQQIRDRSVFLNSLILQKSLSWTRIFLDLEEILPGPARITAIRPSLNRSQQAELHLMVEAASMAPLVEFLKNLESSQQFGSPQVGAQRFPSERTPDGSIAIELTTRYQQRLPKVSVPASEVRPSGEPQEARALAQTAAGEATEEQK